MPRCLVSPLKDFRSYPEGNRKHLEDAGYKYVDGCMGVELTLIFIFVILLYFILLFFEVCIFLFLFFNFYFFICNFNKLNLKYS